MSSHPSCISSISRRRLLQWGTLSAAALPSMSVWASTTATWPTQPVSVLVGFPGGSSPDLSARLLVEELSKIITTQPFVVENRPGAGGNIAAAALARAQNNHTISVMINGNMTIAQLLNPKLSFNPQQDFAPIALIGSAPYVLCANAKLAEGLTPAEFLEKAKAAGNQWNYGSPGIGTVAHLGAELLNSRTGLAAVHVPYQGNPQAMQALLSGEIQLSLLPVAMAITQQKAGNLALIGITSATRSPLTGDLPTLQELGAKDLDLEVWNGVAVPAGMPEPIQQTLREAIGKALATPHTRTRLLEQGWVVGDTSAEALQQRIAADTKALGDIIREQNIRVDA